MNNKQTLLISFNNTYIRDGLCFFPFIIIALFYFLHASFSLQILFFGLYITKVIQGLLIAFINLLILAIAYTFFFIRNKPAAILTQNGIWVLNFGFIPWHMISKMGPYSSGFPHQVIGIYVHDVKFLSRQASSDGKLRLFWAKIFNYPHIFLANTNISNGEILEFAQNFLHKEPINTTLNVNVEIPKHSEWDYIGFFTIYPIIFIIIHLVIIYTYVQQQILFDPNPKNITMFVISLIGILFINFLYRKYEIIIDNILNNSYIKPVLYILTPLLCIITGLSWIGFTLQDISDLFIKLSTKSLYYFH